MAIKITQIANLSRARRSPKLGALCDHLVAARHPYSTAEYTAVFQNCLSEDSDEKLDKKRTFYLKNTIPLKNLISNLNFLKNKYSIF